VNRDWLLERMRSWGDREALAREAGSTSYAGLLARMCRWSEDLEAAGVSPGRVVAFDGDHSERTVALLLALMARGGIAVPLASAAEGQRAELLEVARAEFMIGDGGDSDGAIVPLASRPRHPLQEDLGRSGRPGLILFSSGSTGRPKAMLHDLDRLLGKFATPRPSLRILCFLLLDHIGGINTLLAGLSYGGTIVTGGDRRPESVCRAIARHRVEVLPTSPTFLNLVLLSEEHRRHDLSSLRLITYGAEPMPSSTLERLHREFSGIRLQQTYGLSELGILRSKSRDDGSLWIKVGGEGYQTKVVDGILWIRAETAMLGYLNVASPFDADGWFNTQDAVEQDGEWLRFLGRTSDLINVGGQKVYPAEVESVLLEMDHVLDATVRGEPNPIIGQCVVARVNLRAPEAAADFKARMRRHCHGRLAPYMIPVKVEVATTEQFGVRCKRMRQQPDSQPDPTARCQA
jgi:acyl-CoA synthetase (AMP-forming)/AMP-acid ligase II